MSKHIQSPHFQIVPLLLLVVTASCSQPPQPELATQRLVDAFEPAMISGGQGAGEPPAPIEWRVDDPAASWQPIAGIRDLVLAEGKLSGVTTTPAPILALPPVTGLAPGDLVYEVQVRMRVSMSGQWEVHFIGPKATPLDDALRSGAPIPWVSQAAVSPGDQIETFTLRPPFPVTGAAIAEILIKPLNVAGARFEIESARVISEREHLARVASGVGWQGLGQVFRETVAARAPESILWELTLPDRPRFALHLGTLDERAVGFHVDLIDNGETTRVLERTLTTSHRWESAAVDLDAWRGRRVALRFSLAAEEAGTLGLWGAPKVLSRPIPAEAATQSQHPRGVVLVLVDTLRADRLEAYGHERPVAPALARLAREGAVFRDIHSQATWTKVSAPSLLCSLYPMTSGVRDFPDRLPSAATTLAEAYRAAGYTTVGYASLPFTGYFNNLHQGFEEMHERIFDLSDSKTTHAYVDDLVPWLETHREEPFFVFLHVFDPHDPYEPKPPWNRRWADPAWRAEQLADTEKVREHISDPRRRFLAMVSPAELVAAGIDPKTYVDRLLDWYDGSISGMDAELGRVFERLRELGLERQTLVAFVADHGEEFHDHGAMFHGQSVYQELTHVPWILRYPERVPAGVEVSETAALIDLMPTLLDLSGLAVPPAAQGRSLVPLLGGEHAGWRPYPVFSERPYTTHLNTPPPHDLESLAVIDGDWKLIWNLQRPEGIPEHELYDRRVDPREQTNLATEHPQEVERLLSLIKAWRETATAKRLPSDTVEASSLSPEERERLRSLGYIQ